MTKPTLSASYVVTAHYVYFLLCCWYIFIIHGKNSPNGQYFFKKCALKIVNCFGSAVCVNDFGIMFSTECVTTI